MRTQNLMRHLAWGVLWLVTQQAFPQATQPDNNGGSGSYLGWNSGAAQTLDVKNEGNYPIQWFTDNQRRMLLTPYRTATINGFSVQQHAYLGISRQPNAFNFPTTEAPYSRIHLIDSSRWSIAW